MTLFDVTARRLATTAVPLLAVLGLTAAPAVAASPATAVADLLARDWATVMETPSDVNPLIGLGDPCLDLGHRVVSPVVPPGGSTTCRVAPGTSIFVIGLSSECSTVELPPYYGVDEAAMRACAIRADKGVTPGGGVTVTATLDGKPLALGEAVTGLEDVTLPDNNLLLPTAGTAQFVAHGFATLVRPLTPGTHHIGMHLSGTYLEGSELAQDLDLDSVLTVVVAAGRPS